MANDATVVFNQDSDGTYDGVISGLGNLVKSGKGTLTLSGDNIYTGGTSVDEGTLKVTGGLSASDVTVNTGGILMGTGPTKRIKSLTNYGIVKPGNSVGTLDLNGGAFTQSATGTLEIEVESTVSYDKITNASTAALNGILSTITSGTYSLGDTLSEVIHTSGGISGSFSTLCTQITPTIIWKPNTSGNNVDLVAARDYNNDALKAFLPPNAKNIAAAMATALPQATGDLATVKTVIDNLTTNEAVARAYSEISPEKLSCLPSFSFYNAGQQINNLQNQIYALRTGLNSNIGYASREGAFSGNIYHGVLLAYNGDDWGRFAGESPVKKDRWLLSVNGSGTYAEGDSTANQTGFDYIAGGITAGLSYALKDNVIVGIHTGYAVSDSDLKGSGGHVDADTVSYGVYATFWADDRYYINTSAGCFSNFYDTERNISFGGLNRTATADTSGQQINLFAGSGYNFHFKKLNIGPTATLNYSKIWIESFSETGAGSLNTSFANQEAESLQSGMGLSATYDLELKGKRITPQAYVSYQHEFLGDPRSIDASLKQGSGIFQVKTDEIDRDFILTGCSLAIKCAENISFDIGYRAHIFQYRYFAHSFEGSIDFSF
jgi:outer membrane autotransporter protein